MKFKVSVFVVMLSMFASFAYANSSFNLDFNPVENVESVTLDMDVTWEINEEACTASVTTELNGNPVTISAEGDTCKAAQKTLDGILDTLGIE